ncbi:hypothetical protein WOSG25_110720 [Weissella oryzae SG25]|uniref:Uncharacterized protein n=1 Tax=Weissella oryzae (strain DSM 25784 / JCM 18191 / LMG 30913 / SG25) TaxID=1329250 RepID=A0A069CVT5_WEIOS|nr:hypothetical protein WOSG25_110720 [Weissella oryzae SG25]
MIVNHRSQKLTKGVSSNVCIRCDQFNADVWYILSCFVELSRQAQQEIRQNKNPPKTLAG